MAGSLGLCFVIESSDYSADYLLERIEKFISDIEHNVKSLSEAQFSANKKTLNNLLLQINTPNSANEFRNLFLSRFQHHYYQFNQIFEILKVYEEITLASFQELCSKMTHPQQRRQVVVKSQDKADEIWDESDLMAVINGKHPVKHTFSFY